MEENAIARALSARTRPWFDLTQTNPTRAGLSPPAEKIAAMLSEPGIASYHPEPKGMAPARQAIAAYCSARGARVDPERIFLTASTSEAYTFLFKLLCDPGDAVLVPEPGYPLFEHLAELEAVRQLAYRLDPAARWGIDLGDIEEGLAGGARAVILVSPNNPVGSFVKIHELAAVEELAARYGAAVICDEVFLDFPFGRGPERIGIAAGGEVPALTFSLGGLSKSCGLPQLKLAWILMNGPANVCEEAGRRLDLIADTYLSVATPVQLALPGLLRIGEEAARRIRQRTQRNLDILDSAVASLPPSAGISRLAVEGGWSATLRVPAAGGEEEIVLFLLEREDVLVHPGWFFNFPAEGFLVLSLLPQEEVFRQAAARLLAGLCAQ